MNEQKVAIIDLSLRYARAVDRRDFDALRDLMTADCTLSAPEIYLEGIDGIIQGMAALEQFKCTFHAIHNCLVEISDQQASGEIYCVAMHIFDNKDGVEMKQDWGVRYLDQYVKSGGQWRIRERNLAVDWIQELPSKLSKPDA